MTRTASASARREPAWRGAGELFSRPRIPRLQARVVEGSTPAASPCLRDYTRISRDLDVLCLTAVDRVDSRVRLPSTPHVFGMSDCSVTPYDLKAGSSFAG